VVLGSSRGLSSPTPSAKSERSSDQHKPEGRQRQSGRIEPEWQIDALREHRDEADNYHHGEKAEQAPQLWPLQPSQSAIPAHTIIGSPRVALLRENDRLRSTWRQGVGRGV